MKKIIPIKKDSVPHPNNCLSTRGPIKKISHNVTTSSTTLSSKTNIHQIGSMQNKPNNINNYNIIYDQEFISYINKLSEIISTLHKTNNTNFTTMKNILENQNNTMKNNQNLYINTNSNNKQNKNNKIEKDNNNYFENLTTINNSFNHIESAFNNFYSNAIVLFKKMKTYKETAEKKKASLNSDNNNNIHK